ncbi:MAG: hypothetical protein ACREVY_06135 [Gammaproteobacteria bacterium]
MSDSKLVRPRRLASTATCSYEDAQRIAGKLRGDIPATPGVRIMLDSARIGLNRQAAQKERPDALQRLIFGIHAEHPHASAKDVGRMLEKLERGGVIESIKDGIIEWIDDAGRVQETPLTAIPKRLSRAKKKSR